MFSLSIRRWLCLFGAVAGLVIASSDATAQTKPDSPSSELKDKSPITGLQVGANRIGIAQVVKIIVEPGTNRITLIGSREDLDVVIGILKSLNQRMKLTADPIVTEKIVLTSQLAETVVSIMEASLGTHDPGGPEVKISAVHFPEAILLSGPASAVKRAKQLLATIDRYESLPDSNAAAQERIY